MKKPVLYIHGKGGSANESEHYKPLFPDYDVFGLDYKTFTPWETGKEIHAAVEKLKTEYDSVILIANSIGAFFSMNADIDMLIEKAFFISPIVDMEKLICNMMAAESITEEELKSRGVIPTSFGEELSWEYLSYVREHPIGWSCPTDILYGSRDELTSYETICLFSEKHNAKLTVMENGEHWFHTEEQMRFLDEWIRRNTMDNKSAFNVDQYDDNVRKVIPFYDEIYNQIIGVVSAYCKDKEISLLDTGCGTGTFGKKALELFKLSELVLCDPSEKMLSDARKKLVGQICEFVLCGSENLGYHNRFDVVTAIQSHHYFDRAAREKAVENCFNALKPGGIFIYFENTAPFTGQGKDIMLARLEAYELQAGRAYDEVKAHSARYNKEFFPITINEHFELLKKTGFKACELFWHSYMQSGFYAIKGD